LVGPDNAPLLPSKTRTFWNSVTGADGACCAMHTLHAAANSAAAIPNLGTVTIMGILRKHLKGPDTPQGVAATGSENSSKPGPAG
jgi:hypothetical protein